AVSGTYAVELTVEGWRQAQDGRATLILGVLENNQQTITLSSVGTSIVAGATGSVAAETGSMLTFVAAGASTGSYTWSVDGVIQNTSGPVLNAAFTSPGAHTVTAAAAAAPFFSVSADATFYVNV